MSQQTIAIMYYPIPNVPGAFHESLVYTDSAGNKQVLSAGPSDPSSGSASQKGSALITEEVALEAGQPTGRGYIAANPATTFTVDQQNTDNQAYVSTFLRNGAPLQTNVVVSGSDLSGQWATIQCAVASINSAQIPYSSISQNSNSAASMALVAAGLQPPSYAPALILDTPYPDPTTAPPPWTPARRTQTRPRQLSPAAANPQTSIHIICTGVEN